MGNATLQKMLETTFLYLYLKWSERPFLWFVLEIGQ